MPAQSYLNFDLRFEKRDNGYESIVECPAGQCQERFAMPVSPEELQAFRDTLTLPEGDPADARSTGKRIAVSEFGGRLFDAVFDGQVRSLYHQSMTEARLKGNAGIRVRLRFPKTPELAALPWEYLYDTDTRYFLTLSDQTPIVRYLERAAPEEPLSVEPPIAILAMISSPGDYSELEVETEWKKLSQALAPLTEQGLVSLDRLEGAATIDGLHERLLERDYHIFHFIGHGTYDCNVGGILIMTDENGNGVPVSATDLADLLRVERTLKLVVLNACEGAGGMELDTFAGVAQALVQAEVPAVVAMHYEVSDDVAVTMTSMLYKALARGNPIDAALAHARLAIKFQRSHEWGNPVLFMRSSDGRIFDLKIVGAAPPLPDSGTPAKLEPAQAALELLPVLMQVAQIREAVGRFTADFEASCEQACLLTRYKHLHDYFQQIESTYYLLYHDVRRVARDPCEWEAVRRDEAELGGIIEDLLAVADSHGAGAAGWLPQLTRARGELRDALASRDLEMLRTSLRSFGKILGREPSRLNHQLVSAGQAMRLGHLIQAMTRVEETLGTRTLDPVAQDRLRELGVGIRSLRSFADALERMVALHDCFQEIEDELRRSEAFLDEELTELREAWPDIALRLRTLCETHRHDWVPRLEGHARELERALAGADPEAIRPAFRGVRAIVMRRFNQVDQQLLQHCRQLEVVGAPLARIVEVIKNA